MAFRNDPGAFFLATLLAPEQKLVKNLLQAAKEAGYTRVVEPCAGAFAMTHLAKQAGYSSKNIEASDVTLFSSVMGYALSGKPLDELNIKAKDFTKEEMSDPATVMYAIMYYRTANMVRNDYTYELLRDIEKKRDDYINSLREQVKRAQEVAGGIAYEPLCMWKHMERVMDDQHTILIINPPTYKAGFEKYYDTGGMITWNEPDYAIFDPQTGYKELYDKYGDAKALFLVYEEDEPKKSAGEPVFARYGVRNGVNVYLTSNRPDEVEKLLNGKTISRPNESKVEKLNCSIMPVDYEITPDSKVEVMQIESNKAQYYRRLWTHGFVGSRAPINMAIFVDGMIAGVFGYDKAALTMGAFGTRVSDSVFLMYGMQVQSTKYRLSRLVTMIAQNRDNVMGICDDLEKEKAKTLKTVQQTKYPVAKEMRGLMKLTERVENDRFGYKLTYVSDFKDRTMRETVEEFLRREEQWKKSRKN